MSAAHAREPHAPHDPLVGTVLAGTYRLTGVVARGGMGLLYGAEHLRMPGAYVVKVLHDAFAGIPAARERFAREAHSAAQIRHPHVARVIDQVHLADGRPALVAERMVGEDLRAHLQRRRRLQPDVAVAITRQVLAGLTAAHRLGVVHRDIKPSNIFLEPGDSEGGVPHARVIDFGVAQISGLQSITRTGAVVGTPSYMPPEQGTNKHGPVDPRADVYGVGAVLYRMLAGRPPYLGNDASSILAMTLTRDPTPLRTLAPSLPQALVCIVERAMARDPNERFASASDMDAALAALASSHQPGRATALVRRSSLLRTRALAVLTTFLGAALVFACARRILESQFEPTSAAAFAGACSAMTGALLIRTWRQRWRSGFALQRRLKHLAYAATTLLALFGLSTLISGG